MNIQTRVEDCNRLIGIGCLDDLKAGVLDRLGGIQP
jgi:hypothetical protein